MTGRLAIALAECDELGVALWLADGKLSFRAGEAGFPDSLRETLRANRDELTALLAEHPRADPEWVPFVALNLDVRWFEFPLVKTVPVVIVNQKPYYRVTPGIWSRLSVALERHAASVQRDPVASGDVQAGAAVLSRLGEWVRYYYRPDQIARAGAKPHPLPPVPRGPLALPPDDQSSKQPAPKVAPRCPPSPKPSRCDRSLFDPTPDPPPTGAGTGATGSGSAPSY